jgi:hypothetical protein
MEFVDFPVLGGVVNCSLYHNDRSRRDWPRTSFMEAVWINPSVSGFCEKMG